MNITAVFGSPRKKGNSETLGEAFLQEAERGGAKVERYHVNKLNISGCRSCYACKKDREDCILKDDATPILESVHECDVLLFAFPVYFFDVPAQMKAFIDRWFSFFKPNFHARSDPSRLPQGKTAVLAVAQNAPEDLFKDLVQRYDYLFGRFGFKTMHLIRGGELGEGKGEAAARDDLMQRARFVARRVLSGEPSDLFIPPYRVLPK